MMFYEMFIFVYVVNAIRFDTFRQQKKALAYNQDFCLYNSRVSARTS